MSHRRLTTWAYIAGLAVLASCGVNEETPLPQAPGLYTLRGRVQVVGFHVNQQGVFAGTEVVRDPDGVAVDLVSGATVVKSTTSVDGSYSFSGLPPGAYQAQCRVIEGIDDLTLPLTIVASDLQAADTLSLVSHGDLFPVPNPFDVETFVYFELPDTQQVAVRVMSLSGDTVRVLLDARRPRGVNQVRWDGTSRFGNPVPAGLYWVLLTSGPDERGQLLFKVGTLAASVSRRAYRRTPRAGRTARRRSRSRTRARR